jgi:IS1 family transposase/transposase-like protein
MIPNLVYYQLVILVLLWLCVMLPHLWPSPPGGAPKPPLQPITPKRKRSNEPKAFEGLTHKPHCVLCAQETGETAPAPPRRPDLMPPTTRRPRTVDTSMHFCPHSGCDYRGWLGLGNLRANGHPSGGPWRQFQCTSCESYFPEHHGTIFHGKQVAVELMVRVLACLAEGLGIRATARVFEVAPNTVLQWLVEAAEQLHAFSASFLCEVHVEQLQLDELYAVLSAVKDGDLSEAKAIKRLSRSPHWVWVAIDPVTKLLVAIDVGERTQAIAQRFVHHVAQVLAPDCAPLFLTDGFREYMTALLTHYGYWVQPPRQQAKGPMPKPRWMPLPQLLYAQVVKTTRRRRLVEVKHRVVFGTMAAVNHVLRPLGWQINTSFIERVNLSIRQHVAAVGRRVATLCKGEAGLRQQLVLYHVYYNFCLPHTSLRQALPQSEPTNGHGSAKVWRPQTPAMAAGLTDHVWTLREVLMYRVPPWPQPQAV